MLNINELESRWKKYKLKTFLPPLVITISLLSIFLVTSLVLRNDSQSATKLYQDLQKEESLTLAISSDNTTIQTKKKISLEEDSGKAAASENTVISSKPESLHKEQMIHKSSNDKLVLKPSLNFMKNISRDELPYYSNEEVAFEEKTAQNKTKIQTQNQEINIEQNSEEISIQKGSTRNDIEHVLKRFKKNNNPALSLFIAQKYYDLGDYHNAYNYALITNEINNNIEESWLIFTKSLVKLGKKEMAVKTLKQYLQYSNSDKAGRLLDNIVTGKFQ